MTPVADSPVRTPTDGDETIRVLMIDDSPTICLAVRDLLSDDRIDFVWCNNATQALETARARQPSVILQDVDMPGLTGYDLLRIYRKTFETRVVPVIMHTARDDPKDKAKAFALGASDYLVKHEDPVELRARLLYHAQRYHRLRRNGGAAAATALPARHEIKVLLVDSSRTSALIVQRALEKEKHITVRHAPDEASAHTMADEYLPTVILLGLKAGDGRGRELLGRFREHESTRDVPVIVLSSVAGSNEMLDLLRGGANDFIEKSSDLEELISRIRSHSSNYYSTLQAKIDPGAGQSPQDDRLRILMIDDSKSTCLQLKAQLASEGNIDFEYVLDPAEAAARAREYQPTVILQDMVMPGVDGLDVLQELRENPATADIPIIVLSGIDKATVKGKAFALGANDYINKDVDKIELLSRVQYHSQAYRNSRRLDEHVQRSLEAKKKIEIYGHFIRKTFGRYLSEDIVDNLLESPDGLQLGGEKRVITVMMSDLRGFTSMGERLDPQHVIRVINNYLAVMTELIQKYGGTIDEFIGDAILAMFGAPKQDDDHPTKAVACAIEMQRAMERVNAMNAAEGLPEVEMGIGVNTGELVVGNIGSERRAKYGVVGRHVNICSRIEGHTIGGQVLVSEWTRALVGDVLSVRNEFTIEVKGIDQPIRVHEVAGIGGSYDLQLDLADADVQPLARPLRILVQVYAGDKSKRPGTFPGEIVALGRRRAELAMRSPLEPSSAIEIRVLEGGAKAQAKVLPARNGANAPWRVHLASFDDAFGALLPRALPSPAGGAPSA